jgi:hypothetical protein
MMSIHYFRSTVKGFITFGDNFELFLMIAANRS